MVGLPRKQKQKVRRRAGCGKGAPAATSACGGAAGDAAVNGCGHSEAAAVNGSAAPADAEVDKFGSNGHAWHGHRVHFLQTALLTCFHKALGKPDQSSAATRNLKQWHVR